MVVEPDNQQASHNVTAFAASLGTNKIDPSKERIVDAQAHHFAQRTLVISLGNYSHI